MIKNLNTENQTGFITTHRNDAARGIYHFKLKMRGWIIDELIAVCYLLTASFIKKAYHGLTMLT
jgi:hypothetical protein